MIDIAWLLGWSSTDNYKCFPSFCLPSVRGHIVHTCTLNPVTLNVHGYETVFVSTGNPGVQSSSAAVYLTAIFSTAPLNP